MGEIAESCISMALFDFYNFPTHANYTTRLELHTMDSQNDVVISASSAIDDSTQVKAIAAIIQAFEWKEVVLIYEDTQYGKGVIPYFIDAFQDIDVRVLYRSTIPLDANDDQILKELHKLTTVQTRVFIVHMSSSVGSRLFINANNVGLMSQGYAWIVTDGLSSLLASMDSNVIDSMQGVLGVRPYIPKSKQLEEFKVRRKRKFYSSNISNSETISDLPSLYGIWAYDTVWALAMAVERVGTLDPQFLRSSYTTNSLTDLSRIGYSPIGPRLLQTILSTRFKGLSGDFQLVKGQLKSYAFQIFNVIGEGERVIGYWTTTVGISKKLDTANKLRSNSTNMMSNLKAVVWPGDSTTKPKG
ncbi:glutamate receptor 2.2-like [Macadamia integrifolia]|uniref:glutamate receptor 2.2-like n=1 Tax=Macadamia integrifolia TaxID=60698 RepID=UPI001C531BE0|nr:glutamate receptor 2.2-like [Macadamia integrifolia]